MYKLCLQKAEKPEIKLPTSVGSQKKQGNSGETSASLTMLKPFTEWITTNWKILKEMGIPDHFTCFLRNMYVGQKPQLELDMEQHTGSKQEKENVKAVYYHHAYLTNKQSTS